MPDVENDVARLLELETSRGASLVERDFDKFDALLSERLVHVHSTGVRMNKVELCDYVRGKLLYLSIERENLQVAVRGDTALMTGLMNNRLQMPGKDPIDARSHVTQVWTRDDETWKLAAFHATRVAE